MHYSKIVILYNPNSTGPSQRKAERLARRLIRASHDNMVDVLPTEHQGHGEKLAYEMAKKYDNLLLISSSGDGGYHEVVNGVMRAAEESSAQNVVTGLLPSGNANDHHKELKGGSIFRQILDGETKQIDLLYIESKVNGKQWRRYAHSYIGFGVTPEIGRELNQTELNPANEIIIAAKHVVKSQPIFVIQNGKEHAYLSIFVSNVSKFAKFFALSKESTVDDGKFEVFTLEPDPAKVIKFVMKSAAGGVTHSSQTKLYSFKTTAKTPIQLDGEVFELDAGCEVKITIKPKVLNCVV